MATNMLPELIAELIPQLNEDERASFSSRLMDLGLSDEIARNMGFSLDPLKSATLQDLADAQHENTNVGGLILDYLCKYSDRKERMDRSINLIVTLCYSLYEHECEGLIRHLANHFNIKLKSLTPRDLEELDRNKAAADTLNRIKE